MHNFTFSLYYTLLAGEYSCAFITAIPIVMETDFKVCGGGGILKSVSADVYDYVAHADRKSVV